MASYFDIDDILTEEEKVSIQFEEDSKFNGFLDSNNQGVEDITAGEIIEVPLWLALVICPI